MAEHPPLTEQDRVDLVAYLDGELDDRAAHAWETRLSLDPKARAEAEALRRSWDLLEYLPKPPPPSTTFTSRTLDRLAVHTLPTAKSKPSRRTRFTPWGLAWAATLLLAAGGGFAGMSRVARPHRKAVDPFEQKLAADLRIAENFEMYEVIDEIVLLQELDQADLFGDES